MENKNVLDYQNEMVRKFRYKSLGPQARAEARAFYRENLPEGFCEAGGKTPVFVSGGLKIADGYNRIVIGDYGALVEMLPEQVVHENIRVKPGEEYRDNNPRYSGNVSFSWLTPVDESGVKIQFQKKTVGHTDMVPGRYYVSVVDCVPPRVEEKAVVDGEPSLRFTMDDVEAWLKAHGVFTPDMLQYFMRVSMTHGNALGNAIRRDVPPYMVEMWMCIDDVCAERGRLTFEQYEAVSYNLDLIGAIGTELMGSVEAVSPEIRVAVELGLEGLEFPYQFHKMTRESVRDFLRLDFDDLMTLSSFSKVVAGHKAEMAEQVRDVGELIDNAKTRSGETTSRTTVRELEMA